jgi:hypothetical protein
MIVASVASSRNPANETRTYLENGITGTVYMPIAMLIALLVA